MRLHDASSLESRQACRSIVSTMDGGVGEEVKDQSKKTKVPNNTTHASLAKTA